MTADKLIGEECLANFPLGSRARTVKGCRMAGPFEGLVVGHGKWDCYAEVKLKKDNGKIVSCHAVNLVRCYGNEPVDGLLAPDKLAWWIENLSLRLERVERRLGL